MPSNPFLSRLGRTLLLAASAVIVLSGMRAASPILGPILIALIITIAWSPAAEWLRARGFHPTAAALTGIGAGVTGAALLMLLVWISLVQLQARIPTYQPRIEALQASVTLWLSGMPIDTERLFSTAIINPGSAVRWAVAIVRRLTEAAGNLFILVLLMAFMMLEAIRFPEKLRVAMSSRQDTIDRLTRIGGSIKGYIVVNAVFGLIAAAINTVFLLVLGVDFAILWGVFSFLLSFVPNIGFVIALVPPMTLALVETGFGRALVVAIGYTVVNFLVDNVIKPRFVGQTVNLSPVVVVVSLLFWGWLLGPIGALVAVPMSIALRFLLDEYPETQWISLLMRDRIVRREDSDLSPVARRSPPADEPAP